MGGKQYAIGIDFGTTYSCVGLWINDRVEIVANSQGNRTTPSYVAFSRDEGLLIGEAALNQVAFNTTNTIFNSKRLIGRRFSEETVQSDMKLWPFKVSAGSDDKPLISVTCNNGETMRFFPEEISSMVLGELKKMAEDHTGSEVKDAVITVPAYFDQSQRQATINAGRQAGLNVLRLINEPTAAAIAYCLDNDLSSNITGKRNVLVFDLGGGTFDVSCLTITNDNIVVKAVGGDSHLGGEDFDNRTVQYFAEIFKRKYKKDISGSPKAMRRLRTACERAKRSLSIATRSRILIDELHEGIDFSETLTRSKFEELNSDLFNKCIESVEKCLIDANMEKKDVDEVVLVGGSSRIVKIQQLVREFMNGKELCKSLNPDEAVAYGAAVQAAKLSGQSSKKFQNLVLVDVTPLSLGVDIRGRVMYVIIPKNTPIPTKVVQQFTTAFDYQTAIKFQVFEGERVRSTDNKLLGEMKLTGIKSALRGVAKVDISFSIQADGILNVSARDRRTGKEISSTIEGVILSGEEIQRMIKEAGENKSSDEMYRRRGEARIALEIYFSKVRNEMKAKSIHMTNDEKRKVENAIEGACKLLDSRGLAEVNEYEEEIIKLMSVMVVD